MFVAIGWAVRNGMPDELATAARPSAALPAPEETEPTVSQGHRDQGAAARPARARHRLRPGAARRPAQRRHARAARVDDPPPDRGRARDGDPAGPDPRRDRPRLARVRVQGPRLRGRARPDHGRPSAGDGPRRRRRHAARDPDDRAGLRPAGDLGPGEPARRGRGARLHRRRRRVGDRHPPDRDDPRATRRSCSPARTSSSCSTSSRRPTRRSSPRSSRTSCRSARSSACCRRCCRRASRSATSARSSKPSATRPGSRAIPDCWPSTRARRSAARSPRRTSTRTQTLRAITLDPAIEQEVATSITQTTDGEYLAMEPARAQAVLGALRAESEQAAARGGMRPGAALLGACAPPSPPPRRAGRAPPRRLFLQRNLPRASMSKRLES